MDNKKEYLSIKQVAEELSVNVVTIRRYIKSGKLSSNKIGKEYRIERTDLEKFIYNSKSIKKILGNDEKTGDFLELNKDEAKGKNKKPKITEKHKNHEVFVGLNSNIMEAIVEMSSDMSSISDLKRIIQNHAGECTELIVKIENDGISDIHTAINILLVDDAIKNLSKRRAIFFKASEDSALIVLPLPPHISNPILNIASNDLVLTSDKDLPPHLKNVYYKSINNLPPVVLKRYFKQVTAIIIEGYVEKSKIFARRNVVNLIFQMSREKPIDIYMHTLPHIPPNTHFNEINMDENISNIIQI